MPTVNRVAANLPASGRRASAAWRVVSMCVMPWRLRVIAVVRMIKNMTIFEKNAPTPTSKFRSSSSLSVAPLRLASVLCPAAFSSSTSSLACQKNRYGLIVVPRIATSIDHSSLVCGIDGMKVARATPAPVRSHHKRGNRIGEEHQHHPLDQVRYLVIVESDRRPGNQERETHHK